MTHDYSQWGEQVIVLEYFKGKGIEEGYLVDVGAFGSKSSNVLALLQQGWEGLLVDANPSRLDKMVRGFYGLAVQLVSVAIVGRDPGMRKLYMHVVDEHCSLDKNWKSETQARWSVWVSALTLADVLRQCKVPQDFALLSIDVEGLDEEVMTAFLKDGAFKPLLIVTEAAHYSDAEMLFKKYGYDLLARTGKEGPANFIFERVRS